MEADATFRGIGFEVGRDVAELKRHETLLDGCETSPREPA
jgi:hypothetical protein